MPVAAGLLWPGLPWTVAWVSARLSPFRRCRRRKRRVAAIGFKARYAQRLAGSRSASALRPIANRPRRTVTQRMRAISFLGPKAAAPRRAALLWRNRQAGAWQWRAAPMPAGHRQRDTIQGAKGINRCQGAGACCDQRGQSNPDTLVTPSGGLVANISTSRSTPGPSRPIRQ